jgi:hypothetical protein
VATTAQDIISDACAPVFDVLPLELAMPSLLPSRWTGTPSIEEGRHVAIECVRSLLQADDKCPALPEVAAAIWLYVDDLDRSHTISQSKSNPVGAYWHGIMHRREGDFSNAKYWLWQAAGIDLNIPAYDPCSFVDQVGAARGENLAELVAMQRAEWIALFNYCVELAKE